MCRTQSLMSSGALLGWLLVPGAAEAQSLSSSEKMERLERQTELLQQQLKALKEELAQTRRKTDKVEAVQAARAAEAPRPPDKGPLVKALAPVTDKVKGRMGGYIAAESVWRQRNEAADIGSNFGTIPFPFSPQYNEHEFHGTARQSRISVLVEGNVDPVQKL